MELRGSKVILREKRVEDAHQDYLWRCDPEVARLDATLPLTMSFDSFLRIFKEQLLYPTPGSGHFAIETLEGKHIGNCMYYDLNSIDRQTELGIVIGDKDSWNHGYGYDAVTTLLGHLFNDKGLERVYLHTLDWNVRAQRSFERCGFTEVKPVRRSGQDFILMEVRKARWLELSNEKARASAASDS